MRFLLVLVVACSGASSKPTGPAPRMDLGCTPQPGFDEAVCASRGKTCSYQAPLSCYGADPGPDVREAEQREYASGRLPCECICADDHEKCAQVP